MCIDLTSMPETHSGKHLVVIRLYAILKYVVFLKMKSVLCPILLNQIYGTKSLDRMGPV